MCRGTRVQRVDRVPVETEAFHHLRREVLGHDVAQFDEPLSERELPVLRLAAPDLDHGPSSSPRTAPPAAPPRRMFSSDGMLWPIDGGSG